MDITLHCTRCFRFKKRSPTTSGARVGLMPKRKNNLSCGSRHHAEGIKQQESQDSASCRRYKTTRIARLGIVPKVQNNKNRKVRHRAEGIKQQESQGSASCRRYKTTRIARFGTVPKEQNYKDCKVRHRAEGAEPQGNPNNQVLPIYTYYKPPDTTINLFPNL